MIHSADDCAAPEKLMFVENCQLWGFATLPASEIASVHTLFATVTEAVILSPG